MGRPGTGKSFLLQAIFEEHTLSLGYATTIHKAQGSTLERVHIDIGRGCWKSGQLYVALSRVRHLDDLTLERPVNYSDLASAALNTRLDKMDC